MRRLSVIVSLLSLCASLRAQSPTTVLLPQFIEGVTGTNSNRVPFAYRVRCTGLLAHATYRYYNQVVTSADAATTNGAGNCIFASATGDFIRTTSVSLSTVGGYGTFTSDATGMYEGWFVCEPTANARFVPGRFIFMRIMLNDGGSGTTVATRLTTADSVRVVRLSAAAGDSTGTGLRCTSAAGARDFVFAFDNITGTGRPISGSFIENDGTANTTANSYAAFYSNSVNGVDGAFGIVLPNTLPNGIQRFERRSFATGEIVASATDADGVWPSGANTMNPSGGTTAIVLTGTDVSLMTGVERTPDHSAQFSLSQNYPNPFNPRTTIEYQIPRPAHVTLKVYDVMGREVATLVDEEQGPGSRSVQFPSPAAENGAMNNLASGIYFCRLQAGEVVGVRKLLLSK